MSGLDEDLAPEDFVLQVRPRAPEVVSIQIPKDTLASLRKVAAHALSHAVPKASSIEYVRGSHRWVLSGAVPEFHAPSKSYRWEMQQAAKRAGIEHPEVMVLALQPGDCAFHHGHMWHGFGKNLMANAVRRSFVIANIPADSRFKPAGAYVPGGYLPGRYKRFGDDTMDESFFPIVWTEVGYRTPFLEEYCGDEPVKSAVLIK